MTEAATLPSSTPPRPGEIHTRAAGPLVWAVAACAALVRLPFLGLPAGADEAGFLQVAHQWTAGGTALYGNYWVDRPPLLITIFRFADATGGLVSLRLVGCAAVALTVLLCAHTARRLGGDRAALGAAVASGALLVSPLMDGLEVNGELLAAPFVAAGLAAIVESVHAHDRRRALALAAVAGASGTCALLVKQNVADVAVFAVVLLAAGAWRGTVTAPPQKAAAAVAGGAASLAVTAAWALAHGTSLVGVFDAMYPFRLAAAKAVADGGSQYATTRGLHLLEASVASGTTLLVVCTLLSTARRRQWEPAVVALTAAVAFDAVSIALGGGYWLHYLIQCVVPLSIWAGVTVARGATGARLGTGFVALSALLALAFTAVHPPPSAGEEVGTAIAHAARPGDTLTTLYGEAQVNFAAGLPSPYEHLWSLPIRTLDPQLHGLDAVLGGPAAPTWLVVANHVTTWGVNTSETQALIQDRYQPVADIAGQTVYLRDGVTRPVPTTTALEHR